MNKLVFDLRMDNVLMWMLIRKISYKEGVRLMKWLIFMRYELVDIYVCSGRR